MKYAQTKTIENNLLEAGFTKQHYTIKTHLQQGNPFTDVTFKPDMLMNACQMRHVLIAKGMAVTIYYDRNDQVWCVTATYYPGIVAGEKEISANEQDSAQENALNEKEAGYTEQEAQAPLRLQPAVLPRIFGILFS